MPRDANSLRIRKWAANGDRTLPEADTPALTRTEGFPEEFSSSTGELLNRELVNQLLAELTSIAVEMNQRGQLDWDAEIPYTHPAVVWGSNGVLYVSVQNSTNIDPTTDTDSSHWTAAGSGNRGWMPRLERVTDGEREVLQVKAWVGGTGVAPTARVNHYVGAEGFVEAIADGVDVAGDAGDIGVDGVAGDNGWIPRLEFDTDNSAYQVKSWYGGGGTEPNANQWLSGSGFAATAGLNDPAALRGDEGAVGANATLPRAPYYILGLRVYGRASGGSGFAEQTVGLSTADSIRIDELQNTLDYYADVIKRLTIAWNEMVVLAARGTAPSTYSLPFTFRLSHLYARNRYSAGRVLAFDTLMRWVGNGRDAYRNLGSLARVEIANIRAKYPSSATTRVRVPGADDVRYTWFGWFTDGTVSGFSRFEPSIDMGTTGAAWQFVPASDFVVPRNDDDRFPRYPRLALWTKD